MNNSLTKPTIILGAGGHAKVVAEILIQSGQEVVGVVTPDKEPSTVFFELSVLGDDDVITKFPSVDVMLANGIGVLPHQNLRWRLANRMRKQGYTFTRVIHPSAIVAKDVKLADGVQIMAGSVIQPGVQIGRDSIINTGVLLDHDCKIAKNCHIASGVVCSGGVEVGAGTFLGAGTVVIQNITVGKNSVVAAGSTIYRNVPSDVTLIQLRQSKLEINNS